MKLIKKLDIVIIFFLLITSFIPNIIFSHIFNDSHNTTYAEIKLDGKIYDSIYLSSNESSTFIIESQHGSNTILIDNNSISITHADCHDSLCVKQGEASKVGESIICLPHKLIIEIKGDENDSSSDMILSY